MTSIADEIHKSDADRPQLLGVFYLGRALQAQSTVERSVLLDKAEMYAKASRNAILIAKIHTAKGKK